MRKKIVLFISDAVLLYVSLISMLLLRYADEFNRYYSLHIFPFLIIFILWLLVFYIANLYEVKSVRNNIHFYTALFQAVTIAATISVLFFYLIPFFGIAPKTNLFIFIAIFVSLDTASRFFLNSIFETRFKKPTLVVGLNPQSLELAKFIQENPQLGYALKCIVDPGQIIATTAVNDFRGFKIIQGINNFSSLIKQEKINTIVVAPEAYQIPEIIDNFYKSLENKVTFYNLSSFYERLTGRVPLGAINQIWFIENLSEGNKRSYELAKRLVDIVFGVILGLVSLIFYPFIILAIKVSSEGSVFYKQRRIGRAGKLFEMLKFRTMRQDAERNSGAVWAKDNDPRITGVGRFLRKTRIDELPQLWNIVRGEMSFVGPRAERPEFQEILKKEVPFYEERYLIKPGLTGWAQINFHYGSSVSDAAEKLKYDLYYIKNRSPILDFGIFLKTVRIMLQQSGK